MRTDISLNRCGRISGLDYRKLIIIVFLLRIILASAYDIFVTITDTDPLLPDSKFYSVRGRYVSLLLEGYDRTSFTKDILPGDGKGREIFVDVLRRENGVLPSGINELNAYSYIAGILYFVFGYFTIWIRVFNISISILSVYLLFVVAKRLFGDLAANLFLVIALFLPTQSMYSITLSRDLLRVFIISLTIWVSYTTGSLCLKKLKSRSCC